MLSFFFTVLFCSFWYSVNSQRIVPKKSSYLYTRDRVLGGQESILSLQRQVVYLRIYVHGLNISTCTGTIISENVILTAAHCFLNLMPENQQWFETGSGNRTTGYRPIASIAIFIRQRPMHSPISTEFVRASEVYVHRNFDKNMLGRADIAMVVLKYKFENWMVVQLPRHRQPISRRKQTWGSGYGQLSTFKTMSDAINSNYTLPQIQLLPRSIKRTCLRQTKSPPADFQKLIGQLICATSRQTSESLCKGDSGGPIFQNSRSGRIVQFGIFTLSENESCDKPGNTMWFVKLPFYVRQIRAFLWNRNSIHWKKLFLS